MTSRSRMKRKVVDDVLGGEETWRDADSTAIACDKYGHPRAYFYQLQIRSADEPMTTCAFRIPPLGLELRNLGTDLLPGISLQMRRMCLPMA